LRQLSAQFPLEPLGQSRAYREKKVESLCGGKGGNYTDFTQSRFASYRSSRVNSRTNFLGRYEAISGRVVLTRSLGGLY